MIKILLLDFKDFKENYTSYELLKHILTERTDIKNINVLIGAKNSHNSDYDRFHNHEFYSLYIDKEPIYDSSSIPKHIILRLNKEDDELDKKLEKEKNMFTIYYDEIKESYEYLKNKISNFHFDLMVSYFIPRNEYMRLMDKLLCIDGEIIFQYYDRNGNRLVYNPDTQKYKSLTLGIIDDDYINTNFKVKINHEEKKISILPGFCEVKNILSPQIEIYIKDNSNEIYENDVKEKYLDFLQRTYHNYDIKLKEFTYQQYEYVLPLNLFKNDLPILYFYVEYIMTEDVKTKYKKDGIFPLQLDSITNMTEDDKIEYKKNNILPINFILPKEKIIDYINFFKNNNVYDFNEIDIIQIICSFSEYLKKDLTRKNYYYILKKIYNVLN